MAEDGMTEFAKMLKVRDPKEKLGVCTGTVIRGFPNIEVRIDEHNVQDRDSLIFSSHLLSGYKREYRATTQTGSIQGVMEFTDTISVGDELIIAVSEDQQTYYVIDKAVRV